MLDLYTKIVIAKEVQIQSQRIFKLFIEGKTARQRRSQLVLHNLLISYTLEPVSLLIKVSQNSLARGKSKQILLAILSPRSTRLKLRIALLL